MTFSSLAALMLSFWQLSVQPVMKIPSKWHFYFNIEAMLPLFRRFTIHRTLTVLNHHESRKMTDNPDIGKAFWTFSGSEDQLPRGKRKFYRSFKSFTGPISLTLEGLLMGIFLNRREDHQNKCSHQSSTVFTSWGPRAGGFPDVW